MAKKKSTIVYLIKANLGDKGENLIYGLVVFNGDEKEVYFDENKIKALELIVSKSKFKTINYINDFVSSEKLNSSDLYGIDNNGFIEFIRFNMGGIFTMEEVKDSYL